MPEWLSLHTSLVESGARLLLAVLLGALVGWERESKGRPAGLRTHMMVALGSAGFALIAVEFLEALQHVSKASGSDPMKIIAGIVGGIGFLCAGTIMQSKGEVSGLTTAASLWVVASVGVSRGAGFYAFACAITVLSLLILSVVAWAERAAAKSD